MPDDEGGWWAAFAFIWARAAPLFPILRKLGAERTTRSLFLGGGCSFRGQIEPRRARVFVLCTWSLRGSQLVLNSSTWLMEINILVYEHITAFHACSRSIPPGDKMIGLQWRQLLCDLAGGQHCTTRAQLAASPQ